LDARKILLTALQQRANTCLLERRRSEESFSEAAIHDLRVAVRRLLALIELLNTITPQARLIKLRRSLKKQLDSLDDLRDTQVMLAEIEASLESLPDLAQFQKYLQQRETQLLIAAEHDVRVFKSRANSRNLEITFQQLANPSDNLDFSACMLATVDQAYSIVIQRLSLVDPSKPASIHSVRVAFKKFRYMIEIICPILADFPKTQFKSMQGYQTTMGKIQDTEVFLQTLTDFSARHKTYGTNAAHSFYEQRHADLINTYIQNMHALTLFWRKTPESNFPWETKAR